MLQLTEYVGYRDARSGCVFYTVPMPWSKSTSWAIYFIVRMETLITVDIGPLSLGPRI